MDSPKDLESAISLFAQLGRTLGEMQNDLAALSQAQHENAKLFREIRVRSRELVKAVIRSTFFATLTYGRNEKLDFPEDFPVSGRDQRDIMREEFLQGLISQQLLVFDRLDGK